MSAFRVLRAAQRKVTPWKNGQGWTAEAAVFPEGATLEGFDWRISFAGTEASGPFSTFPEVDRTLAVLEGRIELSMDGQPAIELSSSSLPVCFPGDVPTSARLIEGPLRDLNVMTRRGIFAHQMQRFALKDSVELAVDGEVTGVICRQAGLRVSYGTQEENLMANDVALFEGLNDNIRLTANDSVEVYWIRISKGPETETGWLFEQ